jgi:Flp pilus assembly protein TadG
VKTLSHRILHRRDGRRRGAEILEAALVLPFVLLLVSGMVEFADYFHLEHNLTSAAREGARAGVPYGATNADVDAAIDKVMNSVGLNKANFDVSITPADVGAAAAGDDVSVTISAPWSKVGISLFGLIKGDHVIKGAVVMRKEG